MSPSLERDSVQRKLLTCIFLEDVLCAHRKSDNFRPMARCWTCPEYLRFLRGMQEEEEKFFEECDKIRKYGYPKSLGDME